MMRVKLNELRSDLHFYPVPFDKSWPPVCPEPRLRKLVRNMIYDGVLGAVALIEMEQVRTALVKQFWQAQGKGRRYELGASGRVSITPQPPSPRPTLPRRAHEQTPARSSSTALGLRSRRHVRGVTVVTCVSHHSLSSLWNR